MTTQGVATLNFTRFNLVGSSCSGQPGCFSCGSAAFQAQQSSTSFVYGTFPQTPGFPDRPLFSSKMGLRLTLSTSTYSKSIEPVGDNQDQVDSSNTVPAYNGPPTSRTSVTTPSTLNYFVTAGNGGVVAKLNSYIVWNTTTARDGTATVPTNSMTDNSRVFPDALFTYIAFAPIGGSSTEGELYGARSRHLPLSDVCASSISLRCRSLYAALHCRVPVAKQHQPWQLSGSAGCHGPGMAQCRLPLGCPAQHATHAIHHGCNRAGGQHKCGRENWRHRASMLAPPDGCAAGQPDV